jgi:hypothetical protein
VRPSDEDSLERREADPPGWHVREKTGEGYPLMGSSPAERQEAVERAFRIKREAMRDHPFEGEGPYCAARITMRPVGSPEVGMITGWVGCGYSPELHPLALEEAWGEAHREAWARRTVAAAGKSWATHHAKFSGAVLPRG